MSDVTRDRILELTAHLPRERGELAEAWSISEDQLLERLRSGPALSVEMICDAAEVLNVPSTYLAGLSDNYGLAVALRVGTVEAPEAPAEALALAAVLLTNLKLLNLWQDPGPRPLGTMDTVRTGYHRGDGQQTARRVRALLRLGEDPLADLTGLVEGLGYPVTHLPLPSGLCGLTVRDDRGDVSDRVILVNSGEDWARQRFTLAHELGHCLFGDSRRVIVDELAESDADEERRANAFARHLLLPVLALRARVAAAQVDHIGAEVLVPRLMVDFGVSREVVTNALVDDQLVSASHPALSYVTEQNVTELMARAGLAAQLAGLRAEAGRARHSPVLSRRAREAHAHGWVHARVVAEVEGRDLDELEGELASVDGGESQ